MMLDSNVVLLEFYALLYLKWAQFLSHLFPLYHPFKVDEGFKSTMKVLYGCEPDAIPVLCNSKFLTRASLSKKGPIMNLRVVAGR